MSIRKSWQFDLISRHPRLFLQGDGEHGRALAHPSCGEGWRDLIERCCVRIEYALADADTFVAEEIKSKYGTLRFYWGGSVSRTAAVMIEEAVALAEARSSCTCETCGDAGQLHVRDGWLSTACEQHAVGESIPSTPDCDNLNVISVPYADDLRVVSCRRYDRDADAFVDVLVDPTSVEIED